MNRNQLKMGKLLVFVVFISSIGCLYSENIATGATHTFRPSVERTIESLDWRHDGSLVVEWYPNTNPNPHWYRYKERAQLNTDTGDFTLQVKKSDSGLFRGQFQVKGSLQYFESVINVIDPVSEPKVTFELNATHITLLCSVNPPVQAEFKWSGPNGFSHVGNSVLITRNENNGSVYFCTAKNEVSKKETEFNLKEYIIEPDTSMGAGAIAAIVIVIVLVVIGAVICWKFFKNMACMSAAPAGTRGEMEKFEGANQSGPNQSMENETSENHNSTGDSADKESQKMTRNNDSLQ